MMHPKVFRAGIGKTILNYLLLWHGIGLSVNMRIVHININQPIKKIKTSFKAMLRVEYNNLKANVRFLSNHPANQNFPGFTA